MYTAKKKKGVPKKVWEFLREVRELATSRDNLYRPLYWLLLLAPLLIAGILAKAVYVLGPVPRPFGSPEALLCVIGIAAYILWAWIFIKQHQTMWVLAQFEYFRRLRSQ